MNNREIRIPEEIAPEVLELASRYYAEYSQGYSASELVEIGKEVQIPAPLIEQAIKDVQARHRAEAEKRQKIQQQRQLFLKIGAGVLAAIAIWGIWTYNVLSRTAYNTDAAWAQVENQLQRRADLIPNLVSVTQAYSKQEQELTNLLVQSRQAYLTAVTPTDKEKAIAEIDRAINRFYDYAAANPQLQSNQLFINVQYEIAGTENRIAVERKRYNEAVQVYNQKISQFPNSLIAKTFGLEKRSFFEAKTN